MWNGFAPPKYNLSMKRFGCLGFILLLILVKVVWVVAACWNNGNFDNEKNDILKRRAYLIERIVSSPRQLLREMPNGIDIQFRGEWALYSCSMLTQALVNISSLYPETREESVEKIERLIEIVLSDDLKLYDMARWEEDPIESLGSDNSHISYLSHLAWMINNYKKVGGSSKYDRLNKDICATMNRRITKSGIMNLPTYPEEEIYVPDMLVAIMALSDFHGPADYSSTVNKWLDKAKSEWRDEKTGLLVSYLSNETGLQVKRPVKGSYSALNCYYLSLIDTEFAKEQYDRLKATFRQEGWINGLKEYHDGSCLLGLDIDAGPIICNLSPSGTAFSVGCATYFEDTVFRNQLLKTAEIAGTTYTSNGKSHYILANVALVGEAIMLAMRTNKNFGK